ncbi:MAG: hypothetical protein RL268_167 [Pseudomonadota bacterium]|jgi:hypothetical protein
MNANTKIEPPGLSKLREPFPEHQISKLPKETGAQAKQRKADQDSGKWPPKCDLCGGYHHPKAVHLDYVGHAAATDRLLDTDIQWTWEPLALGPDGLPALDRNGGLWIRLTVCGVTRLGYGDADGKTGGNAIKEAIGDAIRNAGMRFGMALDLWHKGDLHLDEDAASETKAEASEMPDAEWAKLTSLIKATSADTGAMLKHYGVDNMRHLSQGQYEDAIEALNKKIAKKVKAETNAKSDFKEILEDEIAY